MSCAAPGSSCSTQNDCMQGVCDTVTCLSNVCTNIDCSNGQSCPPGMKCGSGRCTSNTCSMDSDCPRFMKCTSGICTSISCSADGKCPIGGECIQLSNGQTVCVAKPRSWLFWLVVFAIAILACAGLGAVIGFVYDEFIKK